MSAENAHQILRSVWDAKGSPAAELDEECSPNKVCKNMQGISFDGFAEPGADIGAAWREKLAREGKLNASTGSIRDLVLGSSESK
ncbi:MAG: hypothetical protein Q8L08_01140 [Candidatus Nanopelagicaceae bacterium]|nr:hypothetical protein [Candidatus Nanopelagicaceae bacterium]